MYVFIGFIVNRILWSLLWFVIACFTLSSFQNILLLVQSYSHSTTFSFWQDIAAIHACKNLQNRCSTVGFLLEWTTIHSQQYAMLCVLNILGMVCAMKNKAVVSCNYTMSPSLCYHHYTVRSLESLEFCLFVLAPQRCALHASKQATKPNSNLHH